MKTIFSQEQCQDFVDEIRYCLDYHEADTSIYDALKVLEHIMIDYFDNSPLKFEELEVGMWVWDNRIKAYLKIQEIWVNKVIHFDNCCVVCFFQENRFYRKEVKDE